MKQNQIWAAYNWQYVGIAIHGFVAVYDTVYMHMSPLTGSQGKIHADRIPQRLISLSNFKH